MKILFILCFTFLLFPFQSYAQDSTIISLTDGNKWFYHFYKNNGSNSRFETKEIKGDTLIIGKEYKKIFVTSMGNDTTTRMQYWGFDSLTFYFKELELVDWQLSTFYDIRIQQDTTWWGIGSEEILGVYIDSVHLWGDIRTTQKWYYEYDYAIFGWGSYTTTAYGIGPIKVAYHYWNLNTGGYSYTSNLVGAIIDGVLYGDSVLVSVKDEIFEQFESFELSQNYPNPFNPSTKINYQIPELSFVTIKVYDVLGKEVATLVNEEKPAGSYEVEFIGDRLTSGIYFYQLRADNFVETKKMILLR